MDITPPDQARFSEDTDLSHIANDAAEKAPSVQLTADGVEKWTKTPRPRGRQARDPLAQSLRFQCTNMDDMESSLREQLADPNIDPSHTTLEFVFPTSAAFMVYTGDYKGGHAAEKGKSVLYSHLHRTAVSVVDALAPSAGSAESAEFVQSKEQTRKQKAIAKTLIEAVQRADGYRYSFHNNWLSKEDQASRFSYFCNDSTLNKGRAANEGAGMVGKKMRKPAYDCQGLLSVKFSATKQSLELHYKHIPLHATYEERAPPPRKGTKRYKLLEIFEPENLPQRSRKKRESVGAAVESANPKPRKKRMVHPRTDSESNAHLIRDDSLSPIAEFLNSAEKDGTSPTEATASSLHTRATSELPLFPMEKLQAIRVSANKKIPPSARTQAQKPPPLPGMMSGYLAGEAITWGDKSSTTNSRAKETPPSRKTTQSSERNLANATKTDQQRRLAQSEATNTKYPPTDSLLAENKLLKARLLEAEQMIQRLRAKEAQSQMLQHLEAETAQPQGMAGPPGWPPAAPTTPTLESQQHPPTYYQASKQYYHQSLPTPPLPSALMPYQQHYPQQLHQASASPQVSPESTHTSSITKPTAPKSIYLTAVLTSAR